MWDLWDLGARDEGRGVRPYLRRGSFCNKRTRLASTSVTAESSRCFGGVVWGVWL